MYRTIVAVLAVSAVFTLSFSATTPSVAQGTGSISGTVTYAGAEPGPHTIYVYAEGEAGAAYGPAQIAFNGAGDYPYTISDLADGTYFVFAFLDLDDSGPPYPDAC